MITVGDISVVQLVRRLTRDEWGGTESVVWNTSKQLVQRGIQSEIVATSALSQSGDEVDEDLHIKRFGYFYPYLNLRKKAREALDKKGGDPFSIEMYNYLLSIDKLDLIHCHTMGRLATIARLVAEKRGIPYIVSLHGGFADVPLEEIQKMLKPLRWSINYGRFFDMFFKSRKFLELCDGIVCVGYNEFVKIREQYPEKHVCYISNGVECDRFDAGDGSAFRKKYQISDSAKLILCVGRIDYQKNQKMLLELVNVLRCKNENVQLCLVGPITSAVYRNEIDAIVHEFDLANCVRIIEGLNPDDTELADAYKACDLFVLPSIHEPFGIVVLEAWAAGKPVVASRVGGLVKLIENNVNGLLFDPSNLNELEDCYWEMVMDSKKMQRLAENGRKEVEKSYSWSQVVEKLLEFYELVIAESGKRK